MDPRDSPPDNDTPSTDADLESPAAGRRDNSNASSQSRRQFIKMSAAAAGSTLLGACIDQDTTPEGALHGGAPFSTFDHIVVVMFENRSLDNLLGYLYTPGNVPRNQTFNGLAGAEHSCPVPPYINDGHAFVAARISPGTDADMMNPNPDPGEEYQHVNTQLYSIVDPPENAFRTAGFMVAPWNNPASGQKPTMDGFVQDYCNNFVATQKRNPTFDEYRVIIGQRGSMLEVELQIESADDTAVVRLERALTAAFSLRIPVTRVAAHTLPRFELKARRWVKEP